MQTSNPIENGNRCLWKLATLEVLLKRYCTEEIIKANKMFRWKGEKRQLKRRMGIHGIDGTDGKGK